MRQLAMRGLTILAQLFKQTNEVLTDLDSVAVMIASTFEKSSFLTPANASNSEGATSGSFLCC